MNKSFKYAHLADLHLGSWRDEKMRQVSTLAFKKAIDSCIENQVDFILFAGDIFNNALPAIDIVNFLAKTLQQLKEQNIPLYVIPGSHDFSPTNRSMIDVLESAGLLTNVCKGKVNQETKQLELQYTIDAKTNAKITGMLGRRGMLDTVYYENLNREKLEQEKGYKIFMFHTTLTELKPKHLEMIEAQPASFLPKHQQYYAGGHIHHKAITKIEGYGPMTYTGALFPNNFAELEKYSHGGYYLITVNKQENQDQASQFQQNIEFTEVKVKEHSHLTLTAKGKNPKQIQNEIISYFELKNTQQKISDHIITIRVEGKLASGKSSDLNWPKIFETINQLNPHHILKNDIKVQGEEYEEILQGNVFESSENIEESLIKEHLGQFQTYDRQTELQLIKNLLKNLNTSKQEGEKTHDFTRRVTQEINILLNQKSKNNPSESNISNNTQISNNI